MSLLWKTLIILSAAVLGNFSMTLSLVCHAPLQGQTCDLMTDSLELPFPTGDLNSFVYKLRAAHNTTNLHLERTSLTPSQFWLYVQHASTRKVSYFYHCECYCECFLELMLISYV